MERRERLFLPAIFDGLKITARHLFTNLADINAVETLEYPEEQPTDITPRYRGLHRLTKREDGSVRCVACFMCATNCPAECIHIVATERTDDIDDPFIPLQCWWVLERHCENDRGAVLELFRDGSFFRQPMVERHILERLMRRLAARGRQDDFIGCAGLLRNAPTQRHRDKLMAGFSKALEGQALPRLPGELIEQLRQLDNPPLVLRVRLGDSAALGQALSVIANATQKRAKKGCDWIVANDVKPETGTFGGDANTVHLITEDGVEDWPTQSKAAVAERLAERVVETLTATQ